MSRIQFSAGLLVSAHNLNARMDRMRSKRLGGDAAILVCAVNRLIRKV